LADDLIEYYYEGFVSFIQGILDDLKECGDYTQGDIRRIFKRNADNRIKNPSEVIEMRQLFFHDPTKKTLLSNLKKWIYSFLKACRKELKLDQETKNDFLSNAIDFFFSRTIELNLTVMKLNLIDKESLFKEISNDIESILAND
jgi:hypothetical protein